MPLIVSDFALLFDVSSKYNPAGYDPISCHWPYNGELEGIREKREQGFDVAAPDGNMVNSLNHRLRFFIWIYHVLLCYPIFTLQVDQIVSFDGQVISHMT